MILAAICKDKPRFFEGEAIGLTMIILERLQFHVLLGRPWTQVWIGKQDFPVADEEVPLLSPASPLAHVLHT